MYSGVMGEPQRPPSTPAMPRGVSLGLIIAAAGSIAFAGATVYRHQQTSALTRTEIAGGSLAGVDDLLKRAEEARRQSLLLIAGCGALVACGFGVIGYAARSADVLLAVTATAVTVGRVVMAVTVLSVRADEDHPLLSEGAFKALSTGTFALTIAVLLLAAVRVPRMFPRATIGFLALVALGLLTRFVLPGLEPTPGPDAKYSNATWPLLMTVAQVLEHLATAGVLAVLSYLIAFSAVGFRPPGSPVADKPTQAQPSVDSGARLQPTLPPTADKPFGADASLKTKLVVFGVIILLAVAVVAYIANDAGIIDLGLGGQRRPGGRG